MERRDLGLLQHPWAKLEVEEQARARQLMREGMLTTEEHPSGKRLVLTPKGRDRLAEMTAREMREVIRLHERALTSALDSLEAEIRGIREELRGGSVIVASPSTTGLVANALTAREALAVLKALASMTRSA